MAKKGKTRSRRTRRRVSGDTSLSPTVISGTRRKGKKHTKYGFVRSHARRVSGTAKKNEIVNTLIGTVAGALVGKLSDSLTKKFSDKIPGGQKTIEIVKVVGGGLLAIKSKNKMIKGAGIGLAAQGALGAAKEFGIISGMEEFITGVGAKNNDEMLIEMNGVDINSTRFISGSSMEQPAVIQGEDDAMNGDDDAMSGSDEIQYGGNTPMPSVVG